MECDIDEDGSGDWVEGGEGREETSRGGSRKVCRDPFEQRVREDRFGGEDARRIHLLDPDSRR